EDDGAKTPNHGYHLQETSTWRAPSKSCKEPVREKISKTTAASSSSSSRSSRTREVVSSKNQATAVCEDAGVGLPCDTCGLRGPRPFSAARNHVKTIANTHPRRAEWVPLGPEEVEERVTHWRSMYFQKSKYGRTQSTERSELPPKENPWDVPEDYALEDHCSKNFYRQVLGACNTPNKLPPSARPCAFAHKWEQYREQRRTQRTEEMEAQVEVEKCSGASAGTHEADPITSSHSSKQNSEATSTRVATTQSHAARSVSSTSEGKFTVSQQPTINEPGLPLTLHEKTTAERHRRSPFRAKLLHPRGMTVITSYNANGVAELISVVSCANEPVKNVDPVPPGVDQGPGVKSGCVSAEGTQAAAQRVARLDDSDGVSREDADRCLAGVLDYGATSISNCASTRFGHGVLDEEKRQQQQKGATAATLLEGVILCGFKSEV
ncbi:unnamed protein product, partial [Amoebophrya sp. A25]